MCVCVCEVEKTGTEKKYSQPSDGEFCNLTNFLFVTVLSKLFVYRRISFVEIVQRNYGIRYIPWPLSHIVTCRWHVISIILRKRRSIQRVDEYFSPLSQPNDTWMYWSSGNLISSIPIYRISTQAYLRYSCN